MADPRSLFAGKRITVMGLGVLGRGLGDTLFLIRSGADVTVTDLKTADELASSVNELEGLPCTLKLGGHDPEDFMHADMVLRNADVPRSSPFLKIAKEHDVPVEMDESLFAKAFEGTIVGITGTRGKTTTTFLIHGILEAHRSGVFLAGNVPGRATLPLLETAGGDDIVVLELSSWQLQGFHDCGISPNASLFTNIHPDHLNRYDGMEEYIHDKKAVYMYQNEGDFCIFNRDQPETAALADESPADKGFFSASDIPSDWKVRLPGTHNRENISAAIALTRRLGVPDDVVRSSVEEFRGVEHRLQWLGEKNGTAFVNDTTSTTPIAGCAALRAFEGRPILLIAGGSDKKLDLGEFAAEAVSRCRRIALLEGTATGKLLREIRNRGGRDKTLGPFGDLRSAVHALLDEARARDLVLLSPACASFGMFRNEYQRGELFIEIVKEILRGV
jgi:UDP-N-acetylmuramoylalanine--D-glutamate ligase